MLRMAEASCREKDKVVQGMSWRWQAVRTCGAICANGDEGRVGKRWCSMWWVWCPERIWTSRLVVLFAEARV